MTLTVGLVGCAKAKASCALPAAALYTSPLFRLAAAYCRRHYDRWFVLSARHGLLESDQLVAPYDHSLVGRPRGERAAWAERVVAALRRRRLHREKFFVHAGRSYAELLLDRLDATAPLAGLSIGARLAWYKERLMHPDVLRLPALAIRQGNRTIYAFAVDGRLLHSFAAVGRIRRGEAGTIEGYQRPEILSHVAAIRAYLESDGALLPNSIVLAFDRRVRFQPTGGAAAVRSGTLTIPLAAGDNARVAWIVDGQQRAAALAALGKDSFPVCVTAFVARDPDEQRAQFVLVNHTRPLPAGLVHELLPVTDALLPAWLASRRFPARLLDRLNRDADSPLRGRIRTPTSPDGVVKDTAVLAMLSHALTDGVLFGLRGGPTDPAQAEAMLQLLKDYWTAVADVFPDAWARPPRLSRLTHGAGFVAMGFVLDEIAEHLRPAEPTRQAFAAELARLRPYCHWTPESGDWDVDGRRRRWDEFQNTPKDTRRLADFLCRQYRRLVDAAR